MRRQAEFASAATGALVRINVREPQVRDGPRCRHPRARRRGPARPRRPYCADHAAPSRSRPNDRSGPRLLRRLHDLDLVADLQELEPRLRVGVRQVDAACRGPGRIAGVEGDPAVGEEHRPRHRRGLGRSASSNSLLLWSCSLRYTRNECPTGVSFPAPPEEILTGPRTTLPLSISQARCDSRSTHDRAETEQACRTTSGWLCAATAAGDGSPVSATARSTSRPPTDGDDPHQDGHRPRPAPTRRPAWSPPTETTTLRWTPVGPTGVGARGCGPRSRVERCAVDTAHRPASGGGRVQVGGRAPVEAGATAPHDGVADRLSLLAAPSTPRR